MLGRIKFTLTLFIVVADAAVSALAGTADEPESYTIQENDACPPSTTGNMNGYTDTNARLLKRLISVVCNSFIEQKA